MTNDTDTIARQMSADTAKLIVELVGKCEAAYVEADELTAAVRDLREQRAVLLQQLHEAGRADRRQKERIAALCDENRRLRAEIASWLRAAA